MDDRTLGAVVGGAFLVGASALRAQRAAERSIQAQWRREMQRIGHRWRHRLSNLGAAAGGLLGVVVLLYALRATARTVQADPPEPTVAAA